MSIDNLSRWFSLSDGTLTFKSSVYDSLTFQQGYEPFGGSSVQRMLDGTGVKQTNWQKLRTTLSGSGGVPMGASDLDYSKPITISCGVPRSITRPTNSFPTLPSHRTDTGFAPYKLKRVEGFWVPEAAPGDATAWMLVYYPILVCLCDPPKEDTTYDAQTPTSWTLTGEEI